jgi:DNA-binding beta-propeller fold protein YncE
MKWITLRAIVTPTLLVLVAGRAAAGAPLELVQTIPLKGVAGKLDHLAVDDRGMRLFVANKPNNTLDIVDLKAGKLIRQIPDQGKASGVDYAADLDRIFVGNGAGVCNAFDGKDYRLVFSTKLAKADNVHYEPGSQTVFVAHGSTISGLDARTGEVKCKVELPGSSHGFQIDAAAGKLFVNLTKPNQVAVVDIAKQEVMAKYPVTLAEGVSPLAYDAKGGRLFIGCRKKPMVVVLDAKSGKELTGVAIPADIDDLLFDAKRGHLYASCGEGVLAVIEKKGDEYQVIARLETAKAARTCTFSSTLGRLYLGVPRQQDADGPEVRVYAVKDSGQGK